MRLGAVQEDGHGGDSDVRGRQRVQDDLPPGQVPQAVGQPVNGRVQHGPIGKQHRWGISLKKTTSAKGLVVQTYFTMGGSKACCV